MDFLKFCRRIRFLGLCFFLNFIWIPWYFFLFFRFLVALSWVYDMKATSQLLLGVWWIRQGRIFSSHEYFKVCQPVFEDFLAFFPCVLITTSTQNDWAIIFPFLQFCCCTTCGLLEKEGSCWTNGLMYLEREQTPLQKREIQSQNVCSKKVKIIWIFSTL